MTLLRTTEVPVESPALFSSRAPATQVGRYLPMRLRVFLAVIGTEFAGLSVMPHPSIHALSIGPALIVFVGVLLFFGKGQFTEPIEDNAQTGRTAAVLHFLLVGTFAWIELTWPRTVQTLNGAAPLREGQWLGFQLMLVSSLVAAFFPTRQTWAMLRQFGIAWGYAAAAAAASIPGIVLLQYAWNLPNSRLGAVLQKAAFAGVLFLLRLFYSGVVSDPANTQLGTAKFQVYINGGCSGVEGLGLMLVMTVSWLVYTRRELRMARAIWLVPIALAAVWTLNLVRITALIALGDAGHEGVAIHGFHSEAGWILFNAVGFAFMIAANRMRWLRKDSVPADVGAVAAGRNQAMVYVLPFVAVLAASIVGRAASSGFDWLYPLRAVMVVAVLWWMRAEYREMNWRFGWLGIACGVAVFAMWLGLARWQHMDGSVLAGQLSVLSVWQRVGWIVVRAATAITIVPIAEELAFRGFVARRLMAEDVEEVPFSRLNLMAIVGSSVLFGVMHGQLWIAGIVAGLVFAWVAKVKGRLGEAVAAHAVANLLIAAWVLITGDYAMW